MVLCRGGVLYAYIDELMAWVCNLINAQYVCCTVSSLNYSVHPMRCSWNPCMVLSMFYMCFLEYV